MFFKATIYVMELEKEANSFDYANSSLFILHLLFQLYKYLQVYTNQA